MASVVMVMTAVAVNRNKKSSNDKTSFGVFYAGVFVVYSIRWLYRYTKCNKYSTRLARPTHAVPPTKSHPRCILNTSHTPFLVSTCSCLSLTVGIKTTQQLLISTSMKVLGLFLPLFFAVEAFQSVRVAPFSPNRNTQLNMANPICPKVPLTPRPGKELAIVACG